MSDAEKPMKGDAADADAVAARWKKNGLVVSEQTADDDVALAGGARPAAKTKIKKAKEPQKKTKKQEKTPR